MTTPFANPSNGSTFKLRAGGDSMFPPLLVALPTFSGLAGPSPCRITIATLLEVDGDPAVLTFLRRHEIVEAEFTAEGTAWGAQADRRLVAHGCRLVDLIVSENKGFLLVAYVLEARTLTGDLFSFLPATV